MSWQHRNFVLFCLFLFLKTFIILPFLPIAVAWTTRTQCNTCPFMHNADKISGPIRSTKITDRFTGTSANVIYCITCTLCKKIYIGETGRREQISWIYPPRFPKLRNDATIKQQNVTSTHLPPYAYDWPHLPPYLSSLFICYIIVDMPSFPFFCLHLRSMSSYAFTCSHFPSYVFTCSHFPLYAFMSSFPFICLRLPPNASLYASICVQLHSLSFVYIYLQLPSHAYIFVHMLHSTHLSTSAFICLHVPSFAFMCLTVQNTRRWCWENTKEPSWHSNVTSHKFPCPKQWNFLA